MENGGRLLLIDSDGIDRFVEPRRVLVRNGDPVPLTLALLCGQGHQPDLFVDYFFRIVLLEPKHFPGVVRDRVG